MHLVTLNTALQSGPGELGGGAAGGDAGGGGEGGGGALTTTLEVVAASTLSTGTPRLAEAADVLVAKVESVWVTDWATSSKAVVTDAVTLTDAGTTVTLMSDGCTARLLARFCVNASSGNVSTVPSTVIDTVTTYTSSRPGESGGVEGGGGSCGGEGGPAGGSGDGGGREGGFEGGGCVGGSHGGDGKLGGISGGRGGGGGDGAGGGGEGGGGGASHSTPKAEPQVHTPPKHDPGEVRHRSGHRCESQRYHKWAGQRRLPEMPMDWAEISSPPWVQLSQWEVPSEAWTSNWSSESPKQRVLWHTGDSASGSCKTSPLTSCERVLSAHMELGPYVSALKLLIGLFDSMLHSPLEYAITKGQKSDCSTVPPTVGSEK